MHISIFFGGYDEERGISINSARAVYDLIHTYFTNIDLYYMDQNQDFYKISKENIYSNTPDDFAFCLMPIDNFWENFSSDFVIPLIHGPFGEDGQLQKILEQKKIPYLFSVANNLKNMFYKNSFTSTIWKNGFKAWHSFLYKNYPEKLDFLHKQYKKIILKPNDGGSSHNVFISTSKEQSLKIINQNPNINFIIERMHFGQEFSIAIVNGKAYIPIEIEKQKQEIFDNHSKYFPTNKIKLNCPPKFSIEIIQKIRSEAEKIYRIFGARDAIRLDGWVLNHEYIIFTECNPISSMEINGVFWQSVCGNPQQVFIEILQESFRKYNLPLINIDIKEKINIPVLCVGETSEQDVSMFSGANVCIKLLSSKKYNGIPYILKNHNTVIEIPFFAIFKHSCQDLYYTIENIEKLNQILDSSHKIQIYTMTEFIKNKLYIFLALHGGFGEDGTLQKLLEDNNIKFNGSNSELSNIFMDKSLTNEILSKNLLNIKQIFRKKINRSFKDFKDLNFPLIIKPNNDGCSTGVVILNSEQDLKKYLSCDKNLIINNQQIKLSTNENLILEEFIKVDSLSSSMINNITHVNIYEAQTGWIELTVGILGDKVLTPSITISQNDILSAEEKFQEGLGINMTPPPKLLINNIEIIKNYISDICKVFNLNTYARLDVFFNRFTSELILIEVNSLPALTYSTVIFQQAIKDGYNPCEFLEKIIEQKL